jgi:eukaryotic-like serine/threonine-protein kinase
MLHSDTIDDLLDQWEEAQADGRELTPQQLCPARPEIAALLQEKIAALLNVNARMKTQAWALDTAAADGRDDDTWLGEDVQPAVEHRFADLEYLAQGGLGTVFTARDEQLHRDVVLKFIRRRIANHQESIDRFLMESEITSRLDHPGIVPVYGLGQLDGGRLFYVMRYIRGESLQDACAAFHVQRDKLSPSDAAIVFHKLLTSFVVACQTIAYAHKRGIINRDLKPEHIVMGRYGETLVMDWGLAMPVGRAGRFRDESEQTLLVEVNKKSSTSGTGAGTLMFMSPEQAALDDRLTPATDIYSLGATLYVLLTGKAPFQAASAHEFRQKVIRGDCPPPRAANARVPRPLEAVCQKAMAIKPEDRYATALDLAADIERYLADEPVSVLPDKPGETLLRWSRRHRVAAMTGLISLTTLMLVAIVAALALFQSSHQTNKAYQASLKSAAEAHAARQASQQTSATFAARMLGEEVAHRWQVLEIAAADPRLSELMHQWETTAVRDGSDPIHGQFVAWLDEQRQRFDGSFSDQAFSWVVNDAAGVQVGRKAIDGEEFHGQSFARRTYFHGGERELTGDALLAARPIVRPNLSMVYQNRSSDDMGRPILTVSCSVPIRDLSRRDEDPQGEVVGVLGMSFPIRRSQALELPTRDHYALLIDSRPDWDGRRGLVLFDSRAAIGDGTTSTAGARTSHFDAQALARMVGASDREKGASGLLTDFRSPTATPDQPTIAAYAEVPLRRGTGEIEPSGWLVVVSAAAP